MVKTKKKNPDEQVPLSLKHKLTKDTKTIPGLVYSIEKYEQQLILLSKKTDVRPLFAIILIIVMIMIHFYIFASYFSMSGVRKPPYFKI